jgi:protein subunit release factor A
VLGRVRNGAEARPFAAQEAAMESILVEIRAAEGGADAKLLVLDQLSAYVKAAQLKEL